jgi:hypothetical protein
VLSVQLAHVVPSAGLLVISRSGMSSHWRLIISKRRFVPVKTSCTSFQAARRAARADDAAPWPPLPPRPGLHPTVGIPAPTAGIVRVGQNLSRSSVTAGQPHP